MPKKYEYSVILSEQKANFHRRINIILDHPITEANLTAIETKYSRTDTRAQNYYYVVTDWKLLKVTGTFTYKFVYQVTEKTDSKKVHLRSMIKVLDHQITVTTIVQDHAQIENEFFDSGCKSLIYTDFTVLFFQEIPDE